MPMEREPYRACEIDKGVNYYTGLRYSPSLQLNAITT
jgi:hypothetical protein